MMRSIFISLFIVFNFCLQAVEMPLYHLRHEALQEEVKWQKMRRQPRYSLPSLEEAERQMDSAQYAREWYIGHLLKERLDELRLQLPWRSNLIKKADAAWNEWHKALRELRQHFAGKVPFAPKTMQTRLYKFREVTNDLMELQKDYNKKVLAQKKSCERSKSPSWLSRLISWPMKFLRHGKDYLNIARRGLQTILYALTPNWLQKRFYNQKNNTPLTRYFNSLLRSHGKVNGYSVQVKNREILEKIKSQSKQDEKDKVLTFFLPNHVSDIGDAAAIGELNLPNYLLFAKPSAFGLPHFIAKRLGKQEELISVGQGMSAKEQLLGALKNQRSKYIFSFWSGNTSQASGNMILPTLPGTDDLVRELQQMGYKIRIVPVTIQMKPTFLLEEKEQDRRVTMELHPPLSPNQVKGMLDQAGFSKKPLSTYMRTLWDREIQTHRELDTLQMEQRIKENFQD